MEHDDEFGPRDRAFEKLTAPGELMEIMRTMDLNKIGYVFLSTVGEAMHMNWDGHEAEHAPMLQHAYDDLLQVFKMEEGMPMPTHDWGFGGPEYWDPSGKRHLRGEREEQKAAGAVENTLLAAAQLYGLTMDQATEAAAEMLKVLEARG